MARLEVAPLAMEAWARRRRRAGQLLERYPFAGRTSHPLLDVLASGRARLVEHADGPDLPAVDARHRELMEHFTVKSTVIVPLRARGRTLGVMAVGFGAVVGDDHLDMTYDSRAGTAVWRTCRDEAGDLLPYTYDVTFCGTDQHGSEMRLDLHVTPSRAPVPLGAAAYNGVIECFGQATTYSYFQTGMTMTGTLSWGSVQETVTGSTGHVDRQWFPLVANDGGGTGDIRSRAHEWRTINLDNDVDLSIWRQFDRTNRNALQPFSGATTSSPDADPEYADDIEVTVTSYVRWPETIRTLVPPPAAARYMPDRHRLTSRKLDLDLTGEPRVPAPAHGLPLEYMEGPYRYQGTFRGETVSGFAFYERSLALYRDWELADVLEVAEPGERDEVARLIEEQR